MKSTLSICWAFLLAGSLNAQDLHIYYDVAAGTVTYRQDDKKLDRPLLKQGSQAYLHVTNYNDYIYDLEIKTTSQNFEVPSSGVESLFNFSGGGTSVFSKLKEAAGSFHVSGGFNPTSDADKENTGGFGDSKSDRELSPAFRVQREEFNTTVKKMEALDRQIKETVIAIKENIDQQLENQQLLEFKKKELLRVKYNSGLAPNRIRQISLQYMEQILNIKDSAAFDLAALIKQANDKNGLEDDLADYETKVTELADQLNKLSGIQKTLLALAEFLPSEELEYQQSYAAAATRVNAYRENAIALQSQVAGLDNINLQDLIDVRYMYEELQDHRFEQVYNLDTLGDLTKVQIKLVPAESIPDSFFVTPSRPKTLSPIKISMYGGLKVNASVGISFASFFKRPQEYFKRDDVIVATDGDPFSPIITSFFHFYRESKGQVSLGGSFGIGLGISSENGGLQNFFLGPSLILGKGQRFVLTSGIMGGKVNRLSEGYQVGDEFIGSSATVPKKPVYELGSFLGISFNLVNK